MDEPRLAQVADLAATGQRARCDLVGAAAAEDRKATEGALRALDVRVRVKDNVILEDRAVPPARLKAIEDCAL